MLQLLIPLVLLQASYSVRTPERLTSRALWADRSKKLVIQMPAGWKIVEKDPGENWGHVDYNFAVRAASGNGKFETLFIGVLQYSVFRAERKGLVGGKKFRTRSGLSGELFEEESTDGSWDLRLAFPCRQGRYRVILCGGGKPPELKIGRGLLLRLYRNVELRSASKPI